MVENILVSSFSDHETTQAPSAHRMPHTARLLFAKSVSVPGVVNSSFRCTRSLRASGSKLKLFRPMVRTVTKKVLNSVKLRAYIFVVVIVPL